MLTEIIFPLDLLPDRWASEHGEGEGSYKRPRVLFCSCGTGEFRHVRVPDPRLL